jgi:hypothetical protein
MIKIKWILRKRLCQQLKNIFDEIVIKMNVDLKESKILLIKLNQLMKKLH